MIKSHDYCKRPLRFGLLAACLVLVLTQSLVYQQYTLSKTRRTQRLVRELHVVEDRFKGILLNDITAANTLAIIYKHYGFKSGFDSVAQDIMSRNKYVEGLQITEDGVIKLVYPHADLQNTIGINTYTDPTRTREANNALDRNEIYFAGPRKLRLGGIGILGKVPIIVDGQFKGLAVVLTRLPTIVAALKPADSSGMQFAYQLKKLPLESDTSAYLLSTTRPAKNSEVAAKVIPEGGWLLIVSYANTVPFNYSFLIFSLLGLLLSWIAGVFTYRRLAEPIILQKIIEGKTRALTDNIRKLDQNNRELALLNSVNDEIIHATAEVELNTRVCQCLVDPGQYKLVWLGDKPDVSSTDQTVVPKSATGDLEYLKEIGISLNDQLEVKGPTAQCLLTGKTVITNNAAETGYFKPWQAAAKKHGIASSIALPLDFGTGHVSALCVYSGEVGAFAKHEVDILERIAANFSFAVRNIRLKEKDKLAEEQIRQLNADLEKRVQQRTEEVNKLNEVLRSNIEDLQIANTDLESFNYSVSHDLRAPLRAINGYVTLLNRKSDVLDDGTRKLMVEVSRNAQKMDKLIEELLSFARAGKKELEKTNLDMNHLLREVVSSINLQEWNRNTQLVTGDMLPAYGDSVLIKQVLFNLVSNAVKYSREKEKPIIEVGSYVSGGEHTYCVKDNGAGFDMKYYDKLFKAFQRMHSATEFEGTGVGLAIVARIVMKHKGRVWAEAKEGEGATFCFTLPISND